MPGRAQRSVGTILILLAFAGCSERTGNPLPPPAPWEPDAKLLESLAPEAPVEGYRVRPPTGYTLQPAPAGPAGVKAYAWAGPRRSDGTAAQFMVLVLTPPPADANTPLDRVLPQMLDGVRNRRTSFTQTKPESGQLGGLSFLRTTWQGMDREFKREMHGVYYVGKDGNRFVQLSSQDVEPHHEASLKLAEAAILTFKKAE